MCPFGWVELGPHLNLLNLGVHGTAVFFSNRVIIRWNQLDQRAVGASSINVFKGYA